MKINQIDNVKIRDMLKAKKKMKLFLSICASCGFCADSCFLYRNKKDPRYMPSYKAIFSLGKMFKKLGKITNEMMTEMSNLVYGNCVMCRRCYCPFGIDISSMISWARTICRSQGYFEHYEQDPMGVKNQVAENGDV